MFDPASLLDELVAAGVWCDGCDAEGNITGAKAEHAELIELIKAAHGVAITDDAAIKLRDALSAESAEWQMFLAARKRPIAAARAERYREETDALLMKALKNAKVAEAGESYQLSVRRADWDAWLASKAAIRRELPYP